MVSVRNHVDDGMNLTRVFWAGIVTLVLAAPPAGAQSPEDRAMRALSLALSQTADAPGRAEVLQEINAHLLAILGEAPSSALAQAILSPQQDSGLSILQSIQALLAPATEAAAPATCMEKPVILDLAERILDQRAELTGFSSANYGTDAAYLWLQYADPPFDEGLARLRRIAAEGRRPPRQMDQLMLTYAYANLPPLEVTKVLGLPPYAVFSQFGIDSTAALLAHDDGKTYHALLSDAAQQPDAPEQIRNRIQLAIQTATSVYGMSEDSKARIAAVAEANDNPMLAVLVLASREDRAPYYNFLIRHTGAAMLEKLRVDDWGGAVLTHDTPTQPWPGQSFRPMQQNQFDILRAALMVGEADFVSILYNQTGWEAEIASAARLLLKDIESGARSATGQLEDNWLLLYDAIAAQRDIAELQRSMSGFDISKRVRHYAGRAQSTVDWMRAIRAVQPMFADQGAVDVARPTLLSDGFDWAAWLTLANRIAAGKPPGAQDEAGRKMSAELYLAAGQTDQAVSYAQEHLGVEDRLVFFQDLMKRLDRQCSAYTAAPGQSVLRGGLTAYSFAKE